MHLCGCLNWIALVSCKRYIIVNFFYNILYSFYQLFCDLGLQCLKFSCAGHCSGQSRPDIRLCVCVCVSVLYQVMQLVLPLSSHAWQMLRISFCYAVVAVIIAASSLRCVLWFAKCYKFLPFWLLNAVYL